MASLPHSSFVGRSAELAQVAALFDAGAGLVTITGAAGFGKTRLAHEHIRAASDAVFCDLSDVDDLDGIVSAVAGALDVTLPPTGDVGARVKRIGDSLADRDATLVLDNFEQLLEQASHTVGAWLSRGAQLLVTSRQRLALDGEAVVAVGPQNDEESVRLFVDRAAAVRPGFSVDAEGVLEAVHGIVRRCEGNPLAVELAASRVVVMNPQELLERMDDPFTALRSTDRNGSERHRGLERAIAWSWNLLDAAEQRTLAACTVFRGGFRLRDAEQVVVLAEGTDVPVLDLVQQLVEKSLLIVEPVGDETRFRMYLSIREFAARKLATTEEAALLRRHADCFAARAVDWAARAYGSEAAWALAAVEREHSNLVQACETLIGGMKSGDPKRLAQLLLAMDPLATTRGPLGPHARYLERAVAATRLCREPAVGLWQLLRILGSNLQRLGDVEAGLRIVEEAAGWAERLGDLEAVARTRYSLANGNLRIGDYALAEEHARSGLSATLELGDGRLEGLARDILTLILYSGGKLEEALAHGETALELQRELGNDLMTAMSHHRIGDTYLQLGRLDEAEERYRSAVAMLGELGRDFELAFSIGALGLIHHDRGDLDAAAEAYEQAIEGLRATGDRWFDGLFSGYLAVLCLERGQLAEAEGHLASALSSYVSSGDEPHRAMLWAVQLPLARATGGLSEVEVAFDEFEPANERARSIRRVLPAHVELAEAVAAEDRGNRQDARRLRAQAHDRLRAFYATTGTGKSGSIEVRIAHRALRATLGDPPPRPVYGDELIVSRSGGWFSLGSSPPVDCSRRRAVRELLLALAEERLRAPGRPLSKAALTDAGWPGERMAATSARNRLHVALSTLRKMGLGDLLRSEASGYYLDPAVPLVLDAPDVLAVTLSALAS